MTFSFSLGGDAKESEEEEFLKELHQLIQKFKASVGYAGWHGSSTGKFNLKEVKSIEFEKDK